jgi:hypothetical protein
LCFQQFNNVQPQPTRHDAVDKQFFERVQFRRGANEAGPNLLQSRLNAYPDVATTIGDQPNPSPEGLFGDISVLAGNARTSRQELG